MSIGGPHEVLPSHACSEARFRGALTTDGFLRLCSPRRFPRLLIAVRSCSCSRLSCGVAYHRLHWTP